MELSNNTTESNVFALFDIHEADFISDKLDKMFYTYLHESDDNGETKAATFDFCRQLKKLITEAEKEHQKQDAAMQENYLKTVKSTQQEGEK